MQHEQGVVRQIRYRQVFRWLLLLRTFRAALGPTRIIVAVLGMTLVGYVDGLIDDLSFVRESNENVATSQPAGPFRLMSVGEEGHSLLEPWLQITREASRLLDRNRDWREWAELWSRLLLRVVVWTLLGGILVRMFALQLGRDASEGLKPAIGFVGRRALEYLGGPLLPVCGVLLLLLPGVLTGMLAGLWGEWAGWLLGLAVGLFGLLNLIAVLVTVAMLFGWPLMVATISVEGSDGFDGFSRAYSYVVNRTWQALSLLVLAVLYGQIVLSVAGVFMDAVFYVGFWSLGVGAGHEAVDALVLSDALPNSLVECVGLTRELASESARTQSVLGLWAYLAEMVLEGLRYSLFWAVVTVIYLLLRLSDDGVPTDEIFQPAPETDLPVPTVGVAASDQPIVERPGPQMAAAGQSPEADSADRGGDGGADQPAAPESPE